MKIMFIVEDRKACSWDEVKEAVMKNAPTPTEDSFARSFIETALKLVELNIIIKSLAKQTKEAK